MTEWTDGAQKQNLQLAAAQAGVEVAREEVKRRRSGHLPTLDLVASHNWSDTTDSPSLTGAETVSNVVGLQLNVPLFTGGATWAATSEASYLYNAAQENLEAQRRATVRQTRESYLGVEAGISQVQARKQALASAQSALEATQTGYRVGTRTAVDVLNAQRLRHAAASGSSTENCRSPDFIRDTADFSPFENRLRTEEDFAANLDAETLMKYLQKLPPGYRAVFNRYAIDGFSHEEIAEQLGISIGTSKSQLFKAREYLKKILHKSFIS